MSRRLLKEKDCKSLLTHIMLLGPCSAINLHVDAPEQKY